MKNERQNLNQAFKDVLSALTGRPKLLLHVCCAPCLAACLDRLYSKFDITLYYYNPNIHPDREHYLRLLEIKRLIETYPGIKIVETEPVFSEYVGCVKELLGSAEHGEKCDRCISLRIRKTAVFGAEHGFDYFCTTLSASPLKDAERINELMKEYASIYNVKYLPSDFKKENGQLISKEKCNQLGIYRQNYCGCTPVGSYAVAVTGGIASGKSLFCSYLKELGADVISADEVAAKIQSKGDFLKKQQLLFPECFENGALNRNKLREIVLNSPGRRKELEGLLHPEIIRSILIWLLSKKGPAFVEVPLLFETGLERYFDYVINIQSSSLIRKDRFKERGGSDEDFDKFVASQKSDEQRSRLSDITIENNSGEAVLKEKARSIYECIVLKAETKQ
ncbi:MAG: dephospho-CoA kinase [Clostridia bacterium]|nr:dephospho-CoA kinase [Clostridia bacterium]